MLRYKRKKKVKKYLLVEFKAK